MKAETQEKVRMECEKINGMNKIIWGNIVNRINNNNSSKYLYSGSRPAQDAIL